MSDDFMLLCGNETLPAACFVSNIGSVIALPSRYSKTVPAESKHLPMGLIGVILDTQGEIT